MGKYISCGKFEKKYCFIYLAYLINNSIIFALYNSFISIKDDLKKDPSEDDDKRVFLGIFLITFLSYIGQILFIIPEKLINRSMGKKKEKEESETTDLNEQKGNRVELIFNNLSADISYESTINIIIISILLLIIDYLNFYITFNENKFNRNFFFMEFLFLFLISKYFYKMNYYKHQYISIIIIVILEFSKSIIIIINNYSNIATLFKDLSISFILSCLEAICVSYCKGLMLYKYFSPYRVCFIFGIINSSITLILFIIFSFIPVGEKLGFVHYNNKDYFDNIIYVFKHYKIGHFIILIISTIFLGAERFLYNQTINYYSVCHLFILIQTTDSLDILTGQIDKKDKNLDMNSYHLFNSIEIFFSLVFLELIELNFCDLSKNIKKNINKRADQDMYLLKAENRESELFIKDDGDVEDDESINK